jgi:MFS family permease
MSLRDWRIGFYVYMLLSSLVFGMYSVLSRDLVKTSLGNDYRFITSLVAAETVPMLFSVLAGGLSDIVGRKRILIIGMTASIPLYLMGKYGLHYLPILAAAYVTLWTASSPAVTGTFLDVTSSSGTQYSLYAMFGSIGWGAGGLIAGLIKDVIGAGLAFKVASAAILIAFLSAYLSYPEGKVSGRATPLEVFKGIGRVSLVFIAIVGLLTSVNLFYGSFSLRLREIAGSATVFGAVYTTLPAIAGSIVRPVAGRLSDRFSPENMLLVTAVAYLILFPLMNASYGLLAIILWLIPLYPFMDQGSMISVSRRLRSSLQGMAAGVISTASSVAGLLVLLASRTPLVNTLSSITLLAMATSSASIAVLLLRRVFWRVSGAASSI